MSIDDAESTKEQQMIVALEEIEKITDKHESIFKRFTEIRETINNWRNPQEQAIETVIPDEVVITIPVKNCGPCPFRETRRTVGAGYAIDWLCTKMDDKKIAGYIEWGSDEPESVPEWCPYINNKEQKFTRIQEWVRQKRTNLIDELKCVSGHDATMWTKAQQTMCSIISDVMDDIANGEDLDEC